MGVTKVGDRCLILKEIERYRVAAAIANRSEVLKTWSEFRFIHLRCCHPDISYKLTNSNIEIVRDSACFGTFANAGHRLLTYFFRYEQGSSGHYLDYRC